jgi:excisionase family DNA binding protein
MSDARRYVSTLEVAQALGVSVTTVKRWVDEGRLPAQRTPGGHRKILLAEVLQMVGRENWPHVDLGLLTGGAAPVNPADAAGLAERLHRAILAGQAEEARALLVSAYEGGLSAAVLADDVVVPAMTRVGHGWASGDLDVYQEHRGTQACLSALMALKARLPAVTAEDRPLALGGGPEGDHYLLANLLAEVVLLEMGWRVVNLGPNTPMASFQLAVRQLKPRLVWVSCSHLADVDAFVAGYAGLYAEVERWGAAIAVGGRALTAEVRHRMEFTCHGDRLANLAAFARQLWPARAPAEPPAGEKTGG